jgi:formiminotetrahydrofolate cyclodeaminase
MPRFADQTVTAFLDVLASPEPTPGGGTASAIAGAMGTALLMMVSGLPRTRGNTDQERAALHEGRTALALLRGRLTDLADEDAEAFSQVMAAYRLPKANDEEKAARRQAVQRALTAATDSPLNVLKTVADAGRASRTVALHGNRSAVSDVRVALELLEAAAAGAAANVEINLVSLDDEGYRKATASTVLDLTNRLTEDVAAARTALSTVEA